MNNSIGNEISLIREESKEGMEVTTAWLYEARMGNSW